MLAFLIAAAVTAAPALASHVDASVKWHAVGSPGFVTIDGDGGKASCVFTGDVGDCSCDLAAFDTGIDLRNKHMREKYLDTAKYPKATLHVDSAKAGAFKGKLALKGVTKPVDGTFTLADGALEAKFSLSLDDFAIGVPSYLGVTVAKDVAVTVMGKVQ